jgi:DNA gyrase/topoisomerase IV subunit B
MIKNVFDDLSKKYKYEFKSEDALYGLRAYLNLNIIKTSFEAQVKVKLESRSDISIMDPIENKLKQELEEDKDGLIELLERFQEYRRSLSSKKLMKLGSDKKRRGASQFTKLRDCTEPNGELLIGEGDSAVGGIIKIRDPRKHAVLPLKGVIPNSLTKKDLLNNVEVKEIIQAVGCGIGEACDIDSLRYRRILTVCDADPAGFFITNLLILLFSKLMPAVIKKGKLFVCSTPLFGIGYKDKFRPIWSREELEEIRKKGVVEIRRFKGLGEYDKEELFKFTLDEKERRLTKVEWSDKYEKLFELASSSECKRDLMLGKWEL